MNSTLYFETENNRKRENPKMETTTTTNNDTTTTTTTTINNKNNPNNYCTTTSNELGTPLIVLICGSLVYYHCAYRNSSLLPLVSDAFIVLLCSLAILGMLFRQMNISVPVDPLEFQLSQDTANMIVASLANTVGAAESVLRVAATGHDKRLFLKVVGILYLLSAFGRIASGATIAYTGLCFFCLSIFAQSFPSIDAFISKILGRKDSGIDPQDTT